MKTLLKKWFPPMMDSLNGGHIFAAFAYWFPAFILLPFIFTLAPSVGLQSTYSLSWVDCIFCAINSIAVALILKEHLKDSLFFIQLHARSFAGTIGIAVGFMVLWLVIVFDIGIAIGDWYLVVNNFPLTPMILHVVPGVMASNLPIWGTLCIALLVPFAITGLFYAPGFAPVCKNKPWLAYLCVAFVILLPAAFYIFWRGNAVDVMTLYILQLPIHLIACWSYQKTDSVWAPVVSLSIINLLTSLVNIFFT